jgi:hypothetical protein
MPRFAPRLPVRLAILGLVGLLAACASQPTGPISFRRRGRHMAMRGGVNGFGGGRRSSRMRSSAAARTQAMIQNPSI